MSTVSREIARRVAALEWPEDGWSCIWAYKNAWGGFSYKLLRCGQSLDPSPYVRDPRLVWSYPESVDLFDQRVDAYVRGE